MTNQSSFNLREITKQMRKTWRRGRESDETLKNLHVKISARMNEEKFALVAT